MEGEVRNAALEALAAGIDDFFDLVDYCMKRSPLPELSDGLGHSPEETLEWLLGNDDLIRLTDDDRVLRIDLLVDGLVLTHRLGVTEIEAAAVPLTPDLAAVDLDAANLVTQGGDRLRILLDIDDPGYHPGGSLVGPPGWLSHYSPGDLVAFKRVGATVSLARVRRARRAHDELAALARAFDDQTDGDDEIGADPALLVETALLDDPGLFRAPVPPLGELLDRLGLEARGGWVGRAGLEWLPPMMANLNRARERVIGQFRLNPCCVEALDLVIETWRSTIAGEGVESPRSVGRALGHGSVAGAFAEWLESFNGLDLQSVDRLCRMVVDGAGREGAGAHFLHALHLESIGEVLEAERALERAVTTQPDLGPALVELAWYASDRGDPARTVSLLRRAEIDEDDPMLSFHRSLLVPDGTVGRNEPCPCGSGRKYKHCHLDRPQVDEDQRLSWLLSKISTFVTRPDRVHQLYGIAASSMLPDFEPEDLVRATRDDFLLELVMFEGGGVAEFLDRRGPLLPQDEADILPLWAEARLTLWEVEQTDGASTLTLRDTRTGESVDVHDRSTARGYRSGELVLARVLPGWGHDRMSGVSLHVDLRHRDSLIRLLDEQPDADQIASWYGGLRAPPTLSTRENEKMVITEATLRPKLAWPRLEDLLDNSYERQGPSRWQEHHELNEDETIIRATLAREGNMLRVSANARERMDRVLATLGDAVEVVERSETAVTDARRLAEVMTGHSSGPDDGMALPPQVAGELIQKMESRWLEEVVPALGGLTPRQAAADPTRREDLIRLLRSFETPEREGLLAMDPERLKARLGIEDA